jgi:phage-related protein
MPTVAELGVDVSIDHLAEAVSDLDRLEERLKQFGSIEADAEANVLTDTAQQGIDDLQMALFDLEQEDISIPVEVPTAEPKASIDDIYRALQELDEKITTEVDLDAGDMQAEIDELKAQLASISDETVEINPDFAAAFARIAELEAALKAIPDEQVTVEVDKDGSAVSATQRLTAVASRAANQVSALAMAILLLGPALVPVLAVATAGIAALGIGLVGAAGGMALFAGVAMANFGGISDALKQIESAQKAYNLAVTDAQRDAALAKLKAAYDSLDEGERKVVAGIDALKSAWGAFAAQFRPQIFQIAGDGLNFIAETIPKLTPLMQGVVGSVQELETRLIAALNGPFWQQFFTTMSQLAGPVMTSFVTSIGNIITGIAGMLQAFSPFAISVSSGFEEMTASFAEWGMNLQNNPGFKSFISYVQANLPNVLGFIKALWQALVQIVVAAAPIGTVVLSALTGFLNLLTAMGNMNPNLLTIVLVLAGIGAALVNLIGPLLTIITMFGIIAGPLSMLTGLGWLLVGAIVAIVAGLIYAYTHFESFRNVVNGVFQAIIGAVQAAIPYIVQGFQALVAGAQVAWQWLSSTFGPAIQVVIDFVVNEFNKFKDWAVQNAPLFIAAFENIKSFISTAFNVIVTVIGAALTVIMAVWNAIWPGLLTVLQGVWTAISGVISGAMEVIRGIIQVIMAVIAGDWGAVWDGLKMILSGVWTAILGILQGAWQAIVGVFQMLGGLLSPIWNAIWSGIVAVVGPPLAIVTSIIQAAWNVITTLFNFFMVGIHIIWNAIWAVLGPPVEAAFQIVSAIVSGVFGIISALFSGFVSIITTLWNGVWSLLAPVVQAAMALISAVISVTLAVISAIWSTVWNAVSTVASTVWTAISSIVGNQIKAVEAVITGTLSLIKSGWDAAWKFMENTINAVWAFIKTYVTGGIDNVKTTISGGVDTIKSLWTNGWKALGDAVSSAAKTILGYVQNMITDMVNAVTGLATRFFNAGASIMESLAKGITSGIKAAKDAVLGAIDIITGPLPGSPAKIGPLSGHGYALLRGQRFSQDLAAGIGAGSDDIRAIVASMSKDISGLLPNTTPFVTATSPAGGINVMVSEGAVKVDVSGGDATAVGDAMSNAGDELADKILIRLKRL